MGDVREVRLIVTWLSIRGEGVEGSPIRRLVEFWTPGGVRVAQLDVATDPTHYSAALALLADKAGSAT